MLRTQSWLDSDAHADVFMGKTAASERAWNGTKGLSWQLAGVDEATL